MKKKHNLDFQAVTDLVAVHTLAQIAWQNKEEESIDNSTQAGHQSDNEPLELMGEHQSDTDRVVEANSFFFAWRLMKMLSRFFEGRRQKADANYSGSDTL